MRVVLYTVAGQEDLEDERHPNAFAVRAGEGRGVSLAQISDEFPLPGAWHFAFQAEAADRPGVAVWVDAVNPRARVPEYQGRIILAATPLSAPPRFREAPGAPVAPRSPAPPPARVAAEPRPEDIDRAERRRAERAREQTREAPGVEDALDQAARQAQEVAKQARAAAAAFSEQGEATVRAATKGLRSFFGSAASALASATEGLLADEIAMSNHHVTVGPQLAEGAFSTVFSARDARTREPFALKQILCQSKAATRDAQWEVRVHRAIDHPNVLPLVDYKVMPSKRVRGAEEVWLLMPLHEGGSVWDAIERGQRAGEGGRQAPGAGGQPQPWPFPERRALELFAGMCDGVAAIHANGWAHRDIKPHNVLLADGGRRPVLIDLGSTGRARVDVESRRDALNVEDEASVKCSAAYRAPELHDPPVPCTITEKVDVFSLGCTLYAMAFGSSPFESPVEGVMKLALLNGRVRFPPGNAYYGAVYSEDFCSLIMGMVEPDMERRLSLSEVRDRVEELLRS